MLKFFRKIRQKLLFENRIPKYLVYALGEISLVVIGILIAIQIDAWHQYNKDRLEEKDILMRILKDLEADLDNLEIGLNLNKKLNLQLETLVKGIVNKNLTIEEFRENNMGIASHTIFQQTSSTYTESVASGKMSLLVNDTLRDDILNYYEVNKIGADIGMTHYVTNIFFPSFIKNFGHTKEYVLATTHIPNNLESVDIEGVLKNKEYLGVISSKYVLLNGQTGQWEYLKGKNTALKQKIIKEIEQRWPAEHEMQK